jgi:hypothetical protein
MRLLLVVLASWSVSAWAQTGEATPPPPTVAPTPAPAPAQQPPPNYQQPYSPAAYPPPYYYYAPVAPGASPAPLVAPEASPGPAPVPAPAYPPPGYPYPPPYPPPYPAPLPVYEPPEPPPPMPTVSVTAAPIYLLLPMLKLTGELRLGTQGSIALIGGAGWVTDNASNDPKVSSKVTFFVYEVGSQLRYYVTGTFRRGMHVGAEVLYLHVNGSLDSVTGVAKGLALGPFFGWKTTSHAGFTFEVQGGVEVVTGGSSVTDSSGGSSSSNVDFVPLLNLNLGWSF